MQDTQQKGLSSFSCIPCLLAFKSRADQATHVKSEFHQHNLGRRTNGQLPVTLTEFTLRVAVTQCPQSALVKHLPIRGVLTSRRRHDKKKDGVVVCGTTLCEPRRTAQGDGCVAASNHEGSVVKKQLEEIQYRLTLSLFDKHEADSMEGNCDYMREHFSLFIPDDPYLVDREGLLMYLGKKVYEGHQCLYCNRPYPSLGSVRQHMRDRGHRRIGTHLEEHKFELEEFYDFTTSYKELNLPEEAMLALKHAVENRDQISRSTPNDGDWEVVEEVEVTEIEDDSSLFTVVDPNPGEFPEGETQKETCMEDNSIARTIGEFAGINLMRLTERSNLVFPYAQKEVVNRRNLRFGLRGLRIGERREKKNRRSGVLIGVIKSSGDAEDKDKWEAEKPVKKLRRFYARSDMRLGVKGNNLGRHIARKNKIFL